MEWDIHLEASTRLVVIQVTGTIKAGPLRQMTLELREAIQQHQSKQVLLDYTEAVSGLQPYEIFERPKVLQELNFPSDVKVAVLYRVLNEDTQFLENVYRNKSFPVRVFSDRGLGLQWLANADVAGEARL
jgi:hypothetical protein